MKSPGLYRDFFLIQNLKVKIQNQVVPIAPPQTLPIVHCQLPIANCLLPIANCLLPIAYCRLPIFEFLLFTFDLLWTTIQQPTSSPYFPNSWISMVRIPSSRNPILQRHSLLKNFPWNFRVCQRKRYSPLKESGKALERK